MQPRQLHHFLAAIDLGSMSQAASNQNVTQPALSRSIRMLEQKLGVQLLIRGNSGVQLTTEGRIFIEHARGIVASIKTANNEVQAMRTGNGGRIRIGLSESARSVHILNTIADIALNREDLNITLHSDLQQNLLAMLRRNDLDAVIDLERRDLEHDDLHFKPLMKVSMAVLARNGHPVANNGGTLSSLAEYPWVILAQDGATRFFRMLFGQSGSMPNIRLQCTSAGLVRRIAIEKDFLILTCRPADETIAKSTGLVEIATDMSPEKYALSMIMLSRPNATLGTRQALRDIATMLAN